MGTVVEEDALWNGHWEDRHAIVIEGGAPLAHRRVHGVEDGEGVLSGHRLAGTKIPRLGGREECGGCKGGSGC